ncbi:MAG: calcium-binding protein, partial [Pseudomonadota bacterium]
ATEYGFHTLSPLGEPMAPNVVLRTAVNIDGAFFQDPALQAWMSEESARYSDRAVYLDAEFAAPPPPTAFSATLEVTGLGFTRVEGGTEVEIGTLDFGATQVADVLRVPTGTDAPAVWEGTLADEVEALLKTDGLHFIGGAGVDVFALQTPVLPIRGPMVLEGFGGDDILTGSLGDDQIFGGDGDDWILDDSGQNAIHGGAGDDEIALGLSSDSSTARGDAGRDHLTSSVGGDRLLGGSGQDLIEAGAGDDTLFGNTMRDTLDGGAGADRISGGHGNDILTGGTGADVFVFVADLRGWDRITDFDVAEDHLRFRGALTHDDLTITDTPKGAEISWNAGANGVRLTGVEADTLTEDVFWI